MALELMIHIEKDPGKKYADSSCPTDRPIIVPIEHFTVNQYISETRQRNTEGSDITELTEVDRKAPREFVIGHSDKYD